MCEQTPSTHAEPVARCSCGAQCRSCGLITEEDRQAAIAYGIEIGKAMQIHDEIEQAVGALTTAGQLIDWAQAYLLAVIKEGPNWAAQLTGPPPTQIRTRGHR